MYDMRKVIGIIRLPHYCNIALAATLREREVAIDCFTLSSCIPECVCVCGGGGGDQGFLSVSQEGGGVVQPF